MHVGAALNLNTMALFMDSPVIAYTQKILIEGETEETTTHDTLGAEKSF